ncbi:hypothetical protein [Vulgatibacter sp.]|uniref:hypothetical protein n=1 Tax=Vulgatibacter sp. TaxID=1971226 RepID=UPI00356497F2
MRKRHGPAWVLYEESYHKKQRRLVSIIPPRRSTSWIEDYLTQRYVDTMASLAGRLDFKRSPKSYPVRVQQGRHCNPMWIGHDPTMFAVYAKAVVVRGSTLEFTYDILVGEREDVPRLEPRVQTLVVEEPWDLP